MRNSLKLRIDSDFMLNITLLLFLCFKSMRVILVSFVGGTISYIIMFTLLYGSLLLYMAFSKRGIPKEFVSILGFVFAYFVITSIIHPEYHTLYFEASSVEATNKFIINHMFNFQTGIFALLFISYSRDSGKLMSSLTTASIINSAFYLLRIATGSYRLGNSTITSTDTYSMTLGYDLLIPLMVFAYQFLANKKLFNRIFFGGFTAILFYFMLTMGSRGPLLCIVLFVFLYIMFGIDYKFKKITRVLIVLITLSLIYVCLYTDLIVNIGYYLADHGFNSRTVQSMIDSTLMEENGREVRWAKALMLIPNGGPFGYGFNASRYLYDGDYPHNIFLEILVDMGYIGGSIVILLLVLGTIMVFKNANDKRWLVLFIMYFSCAIGRLFVSGSFWIETYFWVTIALGFVALKTTRNVNTLSKRGV